MLIDCVKIGIWVRSSISQTSTVPSYLAMKNTPGLVGDHSASHMRLENELVCSNGPVLLSKTDILSTSQTTTKSEWFSTYKHFFSPNTESCATGSQNNVFEERRVFHSNYGPIVNYWKPVGLGGFINIKKKLILKKVKIIIYLRVCTNLSLYLNRLLFVESNRCIQNDRSLKSKKPMRQLSKTNSIYPSFNLKF